jgi:hypothetical protein
MNRVTVISAFILLVITSCNPMPIQEVPVKTQTIIRERVVPVTVSADSALVNMLLSCDSSNQVMLKELTEIKSASVSTAFKQRSDNFEIKFKTLHDTIYVPVIDTVVIEEKPVIVEKTEIVYKMKSWQKTFMYIGIALTILIFLTIVYKLIK